MPAASNNISLENLPIANMITSFIKDASNHRESILLKYNKMIPPMHHHRFAVGVWFVSVFFRLHLPVNGSGHGGQQGHAGKQDGPEQNFFPGYC
jgi:hypothetical protein